MHDTNCSGIENLLNPNKAFKAILYRFLVLYDNHFPVRRIKLKAWDLRLYNLSNKNLVKKETMFLSVLEKQK